VQLTKGRQILHSLASILRQVHSFRGADDTSAVGDGELLRRFQTRGDEAAFELLVWRHGPMVLGVCRRVLRDYQAAEDAFQATFLTLATKAGSIGVRDAVAGWLYTVAHRVSLAARARQARRAMRESSIEAAEGDEPSYLPGDEPAEREQHALLRAEVERLPDSFRSVIVLCCLEGRTRAEAAEQLGVPMGTVESRLARARERLRRGLEARGLVLAVAPLLGLLAEHASDAIRLSPALVYGTVHVVVLFKIGALAAASTAAELMKEASRWPIGAFRAMVAVAFVAVASLGIGGAFLLPPTTGELSPPTRPSSGCAASKAPIQPIRPPEVPTSASSPPRACHP
jgi:RNA polymerase sigma factor (sigma-70 family)